MSLLQNLKDIVVIGGQFPLIEKEELSFGLVYQMYDFIVNKKKLTARYFSKMMSEVSGISENQINLEQIRNLMSRLKRDITRRKQSSYKQKRFDELFSIPIKTDQPEPSTSSDKQPQPSISSDKQPQPTTSKGHISTRTLARKKKLQEMRVKTLTFPLQKRLEDKRRISEKYREKLKASQRKNERLSLRNTGSKIQALNDKKEIMKLNKELKAAKAAISAKEKELRKINFEISNWSVVFNQSKFREKKLKKELEIKKKELEINAEAFKKCEEAGKKREDELERKNSDLDTNLKYVESLIQDDESQVVNLFDEEKNKFSNATYECIMNLKVLNVGNKNVGSVIKEVSSLLGKTPNRVPSEGMVANIVMAQSHLCRDQLMDLQGAENQTLYTDETGKKGKKYGVYISTDEDKDCHVMGLRDLFNKSAKATLDVFKEIVKDIDKCSKSEPGTVGHKIQVE